jgi:hypothetical protein
MQQPGCFPAPGPAAGHGHGHGLPVAARPGQPSESLGPGGGARRGQRRAVAGCGHHSQVQRTQQVKRTPESESVEFQVDTVRATGWQGASLSPGPACHSGSARGGSAWLRRLATVTLTRPGGLAARAAAGGWPGGPRSRRVRRPSFNVCQVAFKLAAGAGTGVCP